MIRAAFLSVCLFILPLMSWAQDGPTDAPAVVELDSGPEAKIKDPDWLSLAARAEALAARGDASRFAVSRLRAELVVWRDEFLDLTTLNSARIDTVDSQLTALGPVPESGEEPEAIADRRAALQAQRDALNAPRVLAEEAYARANGLIGEFDGQVRQRQTLELADRGPSPLNPVHLIAAVHAVWEAIRVVGVETVAGIHQQIEAGRLLRNLPWAGLFLLLAVAFLVYVRRWVTEWRMSFVRREGRFARLWALLLSLGQIAVSVVGLLALTIGLDTLNIFGLRGGDVIDALPGAGFLVIFGWWLCRHVFPADADGGYLGYDAPTRAAGRRIGVTISWVLAIAGLLDAALRSFDLEDATEAAVWWPFLLVLGILLWRFAAVIKQLPEPIPGVTVSQGRVRGLVAQICTIFAVAGPVLAAIGYATAGRTLLVPLILSLALLGFVLIVQRIILDLSATSDDEESNKGLRALLPVAISLVLYLLSLPIFALIWGARVDDILELWARFREGFSIGESRISPTDFLTFALVFAAGYLLTRFVQATLRKSVMPRTRLDLGGQNAVVAGFGYVGILLAALIAITSAGIDLSNLAIVAGALSVGIGFGLQNIVSNFVSGIILLIERPVSEGDWIEVNGQMGYVRAISVRSTRIETFDRTDVIVPNADLVSGQVTNWTRGNLVGRVIVPVGVAYGSDVQKVTEILKSIAEAHPLVLMEPPPAVLFMGFGADSLDFEIRAILRDVNYVLSSKSEMNYEISKKFAEAGIEIPFAQRDIWLRNPEALKEPQS